MCNSPHSSFNPCFTHTQDYKNLALIYGESVFDGVLCHTPLLEGMWKDLVAATRHYLTFEDFSPGARAAGAAALHRYAEAVERNCSSMERLLTPSLHILICM